LSDEVPASVRWKGQRPRFAAPEAQRGKPKAPVNNALLAIISALLAIRPQ